MSNSRSNYLKVEGSTNLIRDAKSNAILNTDTSGYQDYMANAKKRKKEYDDIRSAVRDINQLKNEMCEIKSMLLKLLDRN